jgi:hypothetical protein
MKSSAKSVFGTAVRVFLEEYKDRVNLCARSEKALLGPEDEIAPWINGHLAYWFGWFAFFPNTQVYGSQSVK